VLLAHKLENRLKILFDWKIALCVGLALSLLIKLGFWQLGRVDEKRQMQRLINSQRMAVPKPIDSLSMDNKNALKYLRVSLNGNYLNDTSIFIVNKFFKGRLGYEVITPFRLKSTDQIVFVNRGWVLGHPDRMQLPTVRPVLGEQHIVAEIYIPPEQSFFMPEKVIGKTWPIRLHRFNVEGFKEFFGNPLFPYEVRLEKGSQGVLERYWPTIHLRPESSMSYAFQWFAMALAVLVVVIVKSTNIVELIRDRND